MDDSKFQFWLGIAAAIDSFIARISNVICWIIIALMLVITYEVASRYLLHSPTVWSYDISYMAYSTFFILGSAYALQKGAHIRTDMFWGGLSDRNKALIDATAYILLFFPALILMFYQGVGDAWYSWSIGERSDMTSWRPYMFPLKSMLPLGLLLLLVQGVSELIKCIYAIRTGKSLSKHEEIAI